MDGVEYFDSNTIHCQHCSSRKLKNGKTNYFHSCVTPVIVSPQSSLVIPLAAEFVIPQDGHEKQDCENAGAKRWIRIYGQLYSRLLITMLGDDLYCHQPICEELLQQNLNFIFTCRPESHQTLYGHLDGIELPTVITKCWNGKFEETYTYRYLNQVPLRDGNDALLVNWFEIVVTRSDGKVLYKNAFATNHFITDDNVTALAVAGRTRWKVENENNNTLKTKDYNLEHNFGHGKQHLSSLLTSLNILAFLFHTLLELFDDKYQLLRKHLPSRKTFFGDLRALTRYIDFDGWEHILSFMLNGLELHFSLKEVDDFEREVKKKVKNRIEMILDDRLKFAIKTIEESLDFYNIFLELQNKYKQETPEKRLIEKAWIDNQYQLLSGIEKQILKIIE